MNLIGEKVKNKIFGDGVVVGCDSSIIKVKFDNLSDVKKFEFPDCHGKYITFNNKLIDNEVSKLSLNHNKEMQKEKSHNIVKYTINKTKNTNKKSNNTMIKRYDNVKDFCDEYKKEIENEVTWLKKNGSKKQKIFDGKLIEKNNKTFIYSFETDDELFYPNGTPINIWINNTSVLANVISCIEFNMLLSTTTNLGDSISITDFSAHSWKLLESLEDRLDEISKNPNEIVSSLIVDGYNKLNIREKIKVGQNTAIEMSHKQPITFVWGPPGTGKTQTLAEIAISHMKKGNRVLMLSYSNVSVDGAIIRVNKLLGNTKSGEVLRYGYARSKELIDDNCITVHKYIINKHKDFLLREKELFKEREITNKNSQRYLDIEKQLIKIQKNLKYEEKVAIRNAKFIATTVSKAIVDNTIKNDRFDVVIFDEASMAYIPQVVFSAFLAKKHFVCMGDFRQLPPIIQSNQKSNLMFDIFEYSAITKAVDMRIGHDWLCMLDVQYRMHSTISDFVSDNIYSKMLKTYAETNLIRDGIINSKLFKGHSLCLADLSKMPSVCLRTSDNSRINILSAMISFSMALKVEGEYEVGIITPYRAQSKLLHSMIRDLDTFNHKLNKISSATVHQFQGSEKDIIIYDAVDCYVMKYPGILLTSTENNLANRLFNVSMTRAKGKFIGVTNVEYMLNKSISKNLMFSKIINDQHLSESCLHGTDLIIKECENDNKIIKVFNSKDYEDRLFKDIISLKKEIRIDIPGKCEDSTFLKRFVKNINDLNRKGVKVVVRVSNKKNVPNYFKHICIENPYIYNELIMIDKKIIWIGATLSNFNFKSEGIEVKVKYRPIIRFIGKYTANTLYGFLQMNNTIDKDISQKFEDNENTSFDTFANYITNKIKCKKCNASMRLKKGKGGKFFLGCSRYPNCDNIEYINKEIIDDYFYYNNVKGKHCVKCGYSLESKSGPYGVYIQCCGLQGHKYKLDEI